jgi:hypothetical protein
MVFALLLVVLFAGNVQAQDSTKEPLQDFQKKLRQETVDRPNHAFREMVRRSKRLPEDRSFEAFDAIRVDVAVVDGTPLLSWPGEEKFTHYSLEQMVLENIAEAGRLAFHVKSLAVAGELAFTGGGEETLGGQKTKRWTYSVPAERSGFKLWVNERDVPLAHRGSVWVDATTLSLVRIESEAVEIPKELEIVSMKDRVDFKRAKVGDFEYAMASDGELTIEDIHGGGRRSQVTYEDYRAYTKALSSGASGEEKTAEAKGDLQDVDLPSGVTFRMKLENEIKFDTAAVGEQVRGVLVNDLKHNKQVLAPKGAVVTGRISMLQRKMAPRQHFVVGLAFFELEFPGHHAEFKGSVASAGPFHGLMEPYSQLEVAREVRGSAGARMQFKPGLLYWDMVNLKIREGLPLTVQVE